MTSTPTPAPSHTRRHDTALRAPHNRREPGAAGVRALPRWAWALAGPLAAALLLASTMPRGPMTGLEAVAAMAVGFGVGLAAGVASRSRWAMLMAPAAFVTVFEVVRNDVEGPTVDAVSFSMYGAIAFLTGRGFLGLLILLPMVLGAAVGAGYARRRHVAVPGGGLPRGMVVRRGVAGLTAVGLVALAVAIVQPARTAPIVGADGRPPEGSIAELTHVEVNGRDLGLMVRGHSLDNPVLLFLAGGPGGTELGAMRRHLPELEQHFTVVTWDQRGTGRSYAALDPVDTYTVESAVADTIAVTNHLRDRFDRDQIYLLGQSWGTVLGVRAVQAHAELYRAYIGTGQMVDVAASDRMLYDDTLAWARGRGDTGLVAALTDIGPPPYDSIRSYEIAVGHEHDVYPYDHSGNSEGEGQWGENPMVPEYSLLDKVHFFPGFLDTYAVLYPQIQDVDFRRDATELRVPTYFVQGAHEAHSRAELFAEWFPMLEAPAKHLTVLDTSGHRPLFEQPDDFVDYLVHTVLARTPPGG